MKQHFINFYSPGTMVAEVSSKPIDSWNVKLGQKMAKSITERHNAIPYAFRFITRGRKDDELDSVIIDRSPFYYFNVKIETYKQIKARNDPKDRILLSNMKCNKWNRVVTTIKGWKCTLPLGKEDIVL